jgi:predicted DNA-binding transcriptional regulator YafY
MKALATTDRTAQLRRLTRLLGLLSDGRLYTVRAIAEHLSVGRRSAYRYLSTLQECGWLIEADVIDDHGIVGYQLLTPKRAAVLLSCVRPDTSRDELEQQIKTLNAQLSTVAAAVAMLQQEIADRALADARVA